ncbi:hepatocellular carcinoma-associated antigen 59 [Ceratobasidium sp. AG-Ba]|nr:hepatocellular carcinoma-associated antigen 59 [Ceratobasidium sp. AG-Ba]
MSDSDAKPLFKKRANRPQPRQRPSEDVAEEAQTPKDSREASEGAEEEKLSIEELIELRKLRRQKQGIDSTKLNAGIVKKKRKEEGEGEEGEGKYGLRLAGQRRGDADDVDQEDDADIAKKIIKSNNFTQQTNKLDVDKHMMKYIEEEMEKRRGKLGGNSSTGNASSDPYDELFRISEKYKLEKKKEAEEGSVTNSAAMLAAIPEVDLGMDTRLKNIEETEKAKRTVSEHRRDNRPPQNANDERHLAAARFFNPHLKVQSDADAMRNAKLEAMGLPPEMDTRGYIKERDNRREVATDEQASTLFL